jgi:hypothetical protein
MTRPTVSSICRLTGRAWALQSRIFMAESAVRTASAHVALFKNMACLPAQQHSTASAQRNKRWWLLVPRCACSSNDHSDPVFWGLQIRGQRPSFTYCQISHFTSIHTHIQHTRVTTNSAFPPFSLHIAGLWDEGGC